LRTWFGPHWPKPMTPTRTVEEEPLIAASVATRRGGVEREGGFWAEHSSRNTIAADAEHDTRQIGYFIWLLPVRSF
jgi:hypothetical protein